MHQSVAARGSSDENLALSCYMDYDLSAADYAAHRKLHTGVLEELRRRSDAGPATRVLEVGCGSGNYIRALAARTACLAHGLDLSIGMISRAPDRQLHQAKGRSGVNWLQGRAARLPLCHRSFDLIFTVDVIHHLPDVPAYYGEVARILRPGGMLCTVTDSEETILQRELLSGYFPETVAAELARYPPVPLLDEWMETAGLACLEAVTVEERYKVSSVLPFRRRVFSALHLISERAWQAGLERLESDLARGPIWGTSRYICLWARRPT